MNILDTSSTLLLVMARSDGRSGLEEYDSKRPSGASEQYLGDYFATTSLGWNLGLAML